jgi:hypothetical protein
MTIKVELPPDVESRLTAEAKGRGVSVEQLVEEYLTSRGAFEAAAEPISSSSFFSARIIDQLIADQGVHPVPEVSIFAGAIPDEDVDEFVSDIYWARSA